MVDATYPIHTRASERQIVICRINIAEGLIQRLDSRVEDAKTTRGSVGDIFIALEWEGCTRRGGSEVVGKKEGELKKRLIIHWLPGANRSIHVGMNGVVACDIDTSGLMAMQRRSFLELCRTSEVRLLDGSIWSGRGGLIY